MVVMVVMAVMVAVWYRTPLKVVVVVVVVMGMRRGFHS